jgi:hypothetical protein
MGSGGVDSRRRAGVTQKKRAEVGRDARPRARHNEKRASGEAEKGTHERGKTAGIEAVFLMSQAEVHG